MTPEATLTIGKEAMELVMLLTTVLLLPGLIVGLLVAVFQAATQINEMTLSFIPKLLITFAVLIMAGPWILKLMMNYTTRLIESIPGVIG
ncbi:MAG: flagellar biosynthesis protein FliQ [Pseudomonadota bacterium]